MGLVRLFHVQQRRSTSRHPFASISQGEIWRRDSEVLHPVATRCTKDIVTESCYGGPHTIALFEANALRDGGAHDRATPSLSPPESDGQRLISPSSTGEACQTPPSHFRLFGIAEAAYLDTGQATRVPNHTQAQRALEVFSVGCLSSPLRLPRVDPHRWRHRRVTVWDVHRTSTVKQDERHTHRHTPQAHWNRSIG